MAGAEKLPERVSIAFEDRFGVRPLEGYGCTECFPAITVNTRDFRAAPGSECHEGISESAREDCRGLRDGWYNTGDIAMVDEDGVLRITDRLTRFTKSGEKCSPY
jgi:acyl-[acyl-carrier-protein]-phospholipid O-acyltransferase/long-chain-fatty-acid--[acyl-carrier-protein] ligase